MPSNVYSFLYPKIYIWDFVLVGNVSFCDIFNGTNGPKGTGVVTFKNSQKAKIAVSKCHRKEFEGRKLSLFMVRFTT